MRQRSGGVECGKCGRTYARNNLYFCKVAGVQLEDAVTEQSTTISASWGCEEVPTASKKWCETEFKGV